MNKEIYFEERWTPITSKSVPNIIEGMYFISDRGRVISKSSHRKNIKILALVQTVNGYYRVNLRDNNGNGRYYLIHRIEMIEFYPVPNYEDLQVNHFDGNKANNCIWNLEWVTPSYNIKHAFMLGLKHQYHGEDCSFSTITNAQAEQIAQMICSQKYTYQQIANIIGCSLSVVSNIGSGSNWKFIYDKYNLGRFKKGFTLKLSDDQLHLLFQYFQDHKNIEYRYKSDLYRNALKDLFQIDMQQSMTATLSRLYGRQTRRDISDKYDF